MSTEPQAPTVEFNPAESLKVLDELEALARDDSVFVADDFSKHEQAYIRAYVSRRWNAYMNERVLPQIQTRRDYLNNDDTLESKESSALRYFKHRALEFERTRNSIDYIVTQRYHPEELMDEYTDSDIEASEERYYLRKHLDENGNLSHPIPTTDPVELDPQWADVDDFVREQALVAFARKFSQLYEIARCEEDKIRSNRYAYMKHKFRTERGTKQIKTYGPPYTTMEIPIDKPIPEGWYESYY